MEHVSFFFSSTEVALKPQQDVAAFKYIKILSYFIHTQQNPSKAAYVIHIQITSTWDFSYQVSWWKVIRTR